LKLGLPARQGSNHFESSSMTPHSLYPEDGGFTFFRFCLGTTRCQNPQDHARNNFSVLTGRSNYTVLILCAKCHLVTSRSFAVD